jgi:hypothetical protein
MNNRSLATWISDNERRRRSIPFSEFLEVCLLHNTAGQRRLPDPSKHIRDRLRRPLSAPRRPNAATVQRRGDLPKRLRPGGLGLANGGRNAAGECVGRFALAIVWVAVWPQSGDSGRSSCPMTVGTDRTFRRRRRLRSSTPSIEKPGGCTLRNPSCDGCELATWVALIVFPPLSHTSSSAQYSID